MECQRGREGWEREHGRNREKRRGERERRRKLERERERMGLSQNVFERSNFSKLIDL
jgi:hypothetical protein